MLLSTPPRFVFLSPLFLSPEHAGPEERTGEARPHGAADAQRLVRGAAREEKGAFPSSASRIASDAGLLLVAFAAVVVSSSCCCYCSPRLLQMRRNRHLRDVSRRASSGGDGRGRAPGGRQERLALRHLSEFLFRFLPLKIKMLFFPFLFPPPFFFSFFSFSHTHTLFSLSLPPPLRCIAKLQKKKTQAQGQEKTKAGIKPGSCRRSGPPRPSPKTPCRSATRPAS